VFMRNWSVRRTYMCIM